MKITIEPTSKTVSINGEVSARVWEGTDDQGTRIAVLVTLVAVDEKESPEVHERFGKALRETKAPTDLSQAFSLRMVI